ncbi:MAG: hypothetical protein M3281_03370 [Chloroflexota bacterium]|nr:hypothetical protein [Chloroflexota bacterium]
MKREFIIERQGKSFVLYAGLLEEAHEQGLKEITTSLIQLPTPGNRNVAVCHAVVETDRGRFTGIGDASPDNVPSIMKPHIIRMAETRAKARALRDAVNVGVAAIEELADDDGAQTRYSEPQESVAESLSVFEPSAEPRPLGGRGATEKQLKAIYAIAQNTMGLSKAEVDAKAQDIYGHAPGELSRWEASQFIDLLKQDKVA